ncbi:MAG: clpC, partial [Sporomusa sp.]|nr:clpC [Sporomusa sp.]
HAFGARPLRRAIQKMIEDEVSEMIIRQSVTGGDTVFVDADDTGKLKFAKKS